MSFNIQRGAVGWDKSISWSVKDGWIMKNDEKFFIKGTHYSSVYSDAQTLQRFSDMTLFTALGFNTLHCRLKITNFSGTGSNDENLLNTLNSNGCYAIIGENEPLGQIACYDHFADHPCVIAVTGYDDVQVQSVANVLKRYKELKSRYPHRLVYNTGGSSGTGSAIGCQDVMAFQRYPMIFQDETICFESLSSATSNVIGNWKPNLSSKTACVFNNQMFRWYNYETWVEDGVTKTIGPGYGLTYPVPTALTEAHYRNILYQGLMIGGTGYVAYGWADWVTRQKDNGALDPDSGSFAGIQYDPVTGLTRENNLTTNTALRDGVRRCNAELDYLMDYFKYGERRPLAYPSQSYGTTWAYKGKLLIIVLNGSAAPSTTTNTTEVMYNMRGKAVSPFPWRTATSLTNTTKSLILTALPWNATEVYEVAIRD